MTTATMIWIICIQLLVIVEIVIRRNLQKQYNQILKSQHDRIADLENQIKDNK